MKNYSLSPTWKKVAGGVEFKLKSRKQNIIITGSTPSLILFPTFRLGGDANFRSMISRFEKNLSLYYSELNNLASIAFILWRKISEKRDLKFASPFKYDAWPLRPRDVAVNCPLSLIYSLYYFCKILQIIFTIIF